MATNEQVHKALGLPRGDCDRPNCCDGRQLETLPNYTTDDALALRTIMPWLKSQKCAVRILYPANFENVTVELFRHPREEGDMVRLFTAIKKTLAEALCAVVIAKAEE